MGCFNKNQMKTQFMIIFCFVLILVIVFQDQIRQISYEVLEHHHENNRKGDNIRVHLHNNTREGDNASTHTRIHLHKNSRKDDIARVHQRHDGFGPNLNRNISFLSSQDAIPHIIHQSWKNSLIHLIFQPWILSWRRNHPSWQYWFWTDIDLIVLVQKRFSQYKKLFDRYQSQIEKVDMAKYMILYEYGGVFADLDVVSLRPIDPVLRGNALVLVKEPWIHSNLFDKMEMVVSNAIMASRPKHPFMKWILDYLQDDVNNTSCPIVERTGHYLLTKELKRYNQTFPEPLAMNRVTLLEHYVFFPRPKPQSEQQSKSICKEWNFLSDIQRNACNKLNNGSYRFFIDPIRSFTDHKWLGTYQHQISVQPGDIGIAELLGNTNHSFQNPVQHLHQV